MALFTQQSMLGTGGQNFTSPGWTRDFGSLFNGRT
jgi:hypothetical protein